jgi:hypothetical protein
MLLLAIRCSNLPLLSLPACPSIALPAAQLEEALSFCIAGYEVGVSVLQSGQRICLYPFPPGMPICEEQL